MRVNIIRLFILIATFGSILQHAGLNSAIPAGASEPISMLLLGTGLIAATRSVLRPVTLAVTDISRIAMSVASEDREALTVVNAATTDGGGERIEIQVTLSGCHDGECRVMVNVPRPDRQEFEAEFRSRLREAIDQHASDSKLNLFGW